MAWGALGVGLGSYTCGASEGIWLAEGTDRWVTSRLSLLLLSGSCPCASH